ncbi:hypothetical protein [Listeria farberi]|uniref:Uncharacterized protein n=1 Tax=Listeria farberi TaxID=2713500 RepID=A0A7X0ZFY5_9LIST|nr:hypothetical protein [Listeria farberi]MBC2286525.1 hypothetical protein [Listeria farberi]
MKEFNLLNCIGKALNSPETQRLLNITNIPEEKLQRSVHAFTTFGISKYVELHFQKATIIQLYLEDESKYIQETFKPLINQMLEEPNNMLFLEAILINNNSLFELGYHLPVSIKINKSTKEELLNILGEPYLVNTMFNSVGWRINDYNFACGFDEANDILMDITISIF